MSKQEHPYAQVLRWISDGETIETRDARNLFFSTTPQTVLSMIYEGRPLDWFRLKVRTININGSDTPEPMRKTPELGATYYYPVLTYDKTLCESHSWAGDQYDLGYFDHGLCHATQEAAEAHARALLSFTTSEKTE